MRTTSDNLREGPLNYHVTRVPLARGLIATGMSHPLPSQLPEWVKTDSATRQRACPFSHRKQTLPAPTNFVRFVPCVDGSALARTFCTSQVWSEQPCVRPVNAARMTAGHNALRGSGPGQKPALDSAVAHVGCPDLRIDRICITCCWSFPTFTSRRLTDAISLTPQVRRVLCSARPWPSLPKPCAQSYSLARWLPPLSVAAPAAQ